jgi:hypothetical protein
MRGRHSRSRLAVTTAAILLVTASCGDRGGTQRTAASDPQPGPSTSTTIQVVTTAPTTATTTACVSGWTISPKPYTQGDVDNLVAESAASFNDMWAVGTRFPPNPSRLGNPSDALLEHWDGRGWTVVPGADTGGRWASLGAVAALAPDNVWAVGTLSGSSNTDLRHQDPLIEHWDGRHWSLVAGAPFPPAAPQEGEGLDGIAAVRPDDVWLRGRDTPGGPKGTISRDLYEHWDGRNWSLFEGPLAMSPAVGLAATQVISSDSSGDVWAAGGKIHGTGEGGQPAGSLVERWNGSQWVETPPPAGLDAVGALAVVGPNDIWAVTGSSLSTGAGSYGTRGSQQFVHWSGTNWTSSAPAGAVYQMAARGPRDVWAVGGTTDGSGAEVKHWDGRQWTTVDTRAPSPVPPLSSVAVAATGAVVAFASGYPRSASTAVKAAPDQVKNYLWIECG